MEVAILGALVSAGYYLNKNKQPRQETEIRTKVAKEELPSDKNIYHSERYYDTWDQEFGKATKAHLKAQDPINENVIPRFYNDLGTRSEMSPQMKSYLTKRGPRLDKWKEDMKRKTFALKKSQSPEETKTKFINESGQGNELSIDQSPMFQPMGSKESFYGNSNETVNRDEREKDMIE